MDLKFNDSNIALVYLQTMLKENYNNSVIVNGDYYPQNYSNYGFAHFIFKYLNAMYPCPITDNYDTSLPDEDFNKMRDTTDCISIANYFACNNTGNKLKTYPLNQDGNMNVNNNDVNILNDTSYTTYIDIYSTQLNTIKKTNDMPIFWEWGTINTTSETVYGFVPNNADRIYNMYTWDTKKDMCELDDLVMSYLLGRTIGPNSTLEEVYYVQKLLIGEQNIQPHDKGLWISDSGNLTELIIKYQQFNINIHNTHPLFVTGYFDIYTEASLLHEGGEQLYGVYGL